MSTCGPRHPTLGSSKAIPELFFVATAIKACYGQLPRWERWSASTETARDEDRPPLKKRLPSDKEVVSGPGERRFGSIDLEYRELYSELRNKALSDIKALVREHVERLSGASSSYDFINLYGMCSFDPPRATRVSHQTRESHCCKFTKVPCPEDTSNSNSRRLVSVSGILNPLISARIEDGEQQLSRCRESDYHRANEEFFRLNSHSKMRAPKVYKGNLGSSIGSMESKFIFTVREDLHALGCAYRQIVTTVELLHLNMLHFIYS